MYSSDTIQIVPRIQGQLEYFKYAFCQSHMTIVENDHNASHLIKIQFTYLTILIQEYTLQQTAIFGINVATTN